MSNPRKQCGSCGKQIPRSARACAFCGAKQDTAPLPTAALGIPVFRDGVLELPTSEPIAPAAATPPSIAAPAAPVAEVQPAAPPVVSVPAAAVPAAAEPAPPRAPATEAKAPATASVESRATPPATPPAAVDAADAKGQPPPVRPPSSQTANTVVGVEVDAAALQAAVDKAQAGREQKAGAPAAPSAKEPSPAAKGEPAGKGKHKHKNKNKGGKDRGPSPAEAKTPPTTAADQPSTAPPAQAGEAAKAKPAADSAPAAKVGAVKDEAKKGEPKKDEPKKDEPKKGEAKAELKKSEPKPSEAAAARVAEPARDELAEEELPIPGVLAFLERVEPRVVMPIAGALHVALWLVALQIMAALSGPQLRYRHSLLVVGLVLIAGGLVPLSVRGRGLVAAGAGLVSALLAAQAVDWLAGPLGLIGATLFAVLPGWLLAKARAAGPEGAGRTFLAVAVLLAVPIGLIVAALANSVASWVHVGLTLLFAGAAASVGIAHILDEPAE